MYRHLNFCHSFALYISRIGIHQQLSIFFPVYPYHIAKVQFVHLYVNIINHNIKFDIVYHVSILNDCLETYMCI